MAKFEFLPTKTKVESFYVKKLKSIMAKVTYYAQDGDSIEHEIVFYLPAPNAHRTYKEIVEELEGILQRNC